VQELSTDSERLAGAVHRELVGGLSEKYHGVGDLGVKKGPFYVLFLSSIPSILVESGFLTNPHDVRLLRERGYLERTADHIAEGVLRYRDGGVTYAGSGRSRGVASGAGPGVAAGPAR
jgi:N-acetylmuramoyl-L-alanine amidase